MKKRNIYQNQSQALLHIFEAAGSNKKVMCVPMDFAKNFVSTLRSKGVVVANVNAHDAKKQRSSVQASTDRIDLLGIKPLSFRTFNHLNKMALGSP